MESEVGVTSGPGITIDEVKNLDAKKSKHLTNEKNFNDDGTEQNESTRKKADKVVNKMGKKSTRRIAATFWVDSEETRKSEFERIIKVWPKSKYILFGPIEWTEENKKPHCHIIIALDHNKQFKTILKTLPSEKYHIEELKNFNAARDYALKSNPDDKLEYGEPLKQGARTDLKKMFEATKFDLNKIKEEYPDKYCQYRNGIMDICSQQTKKDYILNWLGLEQNEDGQYIEKKYEKPIVHWFSGVTGAGKTLLTKKIIRDKVINGLDPNKIGIIDGMKNDFAIGEVDDDVELLIIDEFRGDMLKLHDLLKLIDGSIVNIKNSKLRLKAKEIFITSALTPEKCYPKCCGDASDSIKQLKRRITDERVFYWDDEKNDYIDKPANEVHDDEF